MPFMYDHTSTDQNRPGEGATTVSESNGNGNPQFTELSPIPTFPSAEYQALWETFNGHSLLRPPVNGTATNDTHDLNTHGMSPPSPPGSSARGRGRSSDGSSGQRRGRSGGRHHTRQRFYTIPSERQDEEDTAVSLLSIVKEGHTSFL